MRKVLDKMFVILPFEKSFYDKNNVSNVDYVGHPLLDAVADFKSVNKEDDFRKQHNLDDRPIIALMPGSRKMELRKMMPTMADLASRHPEYNFVIAGMTLLGDSFYKPFLTSENVTLVYNQTYLLLQSAFAGVITSGTATLEAALFHLPQVVCYRANAFTVALAKRFAKVNYISLVNLIADKPVVRELIQKDLNKNTLETEFSKITKDKNNRMAMIAEYENIEKMLGSKGVSDKAVEAILKTLKRD